ncbi:ubiquinone anaerobic biosynthesis accessory factor UbiT [Neptunomonas antarctica]|uniref:Ubiquinone biosynthesis accessory factor UbiT n=1 Tax=Neptunomonas antarctica TaxID=619304 RepID=A0A1N7P4Y8_9GAMM|nr:SCP2 sterol-binding domain-containing protein [Neptunomonas antarctica]SIT05596.1 Predicted lipid carrier protein YhbT, contains SCP2 domain [Neptunomonas antarctica]
MLFTLPNIALLPLSPLQNLLKKASVLHIVRYTEPKLPFFVRKRIAEQTLNYLFREQLNDDEFYFLEGQQLGLDIRDIDIRIAFTCRDEKLVVLPADKPDAWIRGDAKDFIQMAGQDVDPDTLFFQRRLVIEGNTELGLTIKNLMDSVDWSEMPALFKRSIKLAQRAIN